MSESSSADLDPTSKIHRAGLNTIFEKAKIDKNRVAMVASVTDTDLKRRKSFAEKDTDVLSDFESSEEATSWVHSFGIGWSCRKGLKPESPNQDSFSVLIVENDFALYSVFDGHGPHGHEVSNFVREMVVKLFLGSPERTTNPGESFRAAFTTAQSALEQQVLENPKAEGSIDANMSGTTCTMVYHDIPRDRLTVAHVGDSRAVLGMSGKEPGYKDLTKDHKPNDDAEKKRIESSDPPGRVMFDGYYNYRVFAKDGMYPGLNMSRAIGDVVGHKEAGLSAKPDVWELDLAGERKPDGGLALLVCTDGVWEFISSEEAVKKVFEFSPSQATEAMKKLVELGWQRWMQDSDHEISDDITGIYVDLSKKPGA